MEDVLLDTLSKLVTWGPVALQWIGAGVVLLQGIVLLTPSTKDDEFWAKIQAWPLVGGILTALAKKAPFQKKEPPAP